MIHPDCGWEMHWCDPGCKGQQGYKTFDGTFLPPTHRPGEWWVCLVCDVGYDPKDPPKPKPPEPDPVCTYIPRGKEGIHGLALCSGVGGLELGLHLALGETYRCVGHVEREAYAAACLVARMEDSSMDPAPVWDDLATFDGGPWRGLVDLISAGYPCQPFSVAGKQLGAADPRHLWPHVARIIREVQPALVFLENVPGHVRLGFAEVRSELRGMGYLVEPGLFSAEELGAPHRRKRLFALAYRDVEGFGIERSGVDLGRIVESWDDDDRCGQEMAVPSDGGFGASREPPGRGRQPDGSDQAVADAESPDRRAGDPGLAGVGRGGSQGDGRDLADSGDGQLQEPGWGSSGRTGPVPSGQPVGDPTGIGMEGDGAGGIEEPCPSAGPALSGCGGGDLPVWPPGPGDLEAWAGIPASLEPALPRVDDGMAPWTDRLRAAGNGVVPVVAAKAFRVLAARLASRIAIRRAAAEVTP